MSSNRAGPETAIRNYPKLLNRYQRLLELTSDLASTFDLDTLLQRIVVAARELTESEASSLLLYEKQTHSLYFEAATGALVSGVRQLALGAAAAALTFGIGSIIGVSTDV